MAFLPLNGDSSPASKTGAAMARQTTHPDAADWARRVRDNGSTVSASTLKAVSAFCKAIDSAGIRDRFYRLNLFCGGAGSSDGTRLNACLVPLYRGPSRTGTQYGGTTDTNVGGLFATGDYSETTGLTSNAGSSKYLSTGLQTLSLPSGVISSGHISAWHGTIPSLGFGTNSYLIGANNSSLDRVGIQVDASPSSSAYETARYGKVLTAVNPNGVTGNRPPAFLLGQRTSPTNLELWKGRAVAQTNPNTATGIAGVPYDIFVFRLSNSGNPLGDSVTVPLLHYSIGDDMTSDQVKAFFDALSTFNTTMGRTI